jgi:hypothetical protein
MKTFHVRESVRALHHVFTTPRKLASFPLPDHLRTIRSAKSLSASDGIRSRPL